MKKEKQIIKKKRKRLRHKCFLAGFKKFLISCWSLELRHIFPLKFLNVSIKSFFEIPQEKICPKPTTKKTTELLQVMSCGCHPISLELLSEVCDDVCFH